MALTITESRDPALVRKDPLFVQYEIQHHVARFSATLRELGKSETIDSMILMFDRELQSLGDTVSQLRNQQIEICYLGAKLKLYAFSVLSRAMGTNCKIDPSTRIVWYHGFETAVRLAFIFSSASSTLSVTSQSLVNSLEQKNMLLHFPKHIFWILAEVASYLLNFLAVNHEATEVERQLARDNIRIVHSVLLCWSSQELDEPARTARAISMLSNTERQGEWPHLDRANRRLIPSLLTNTMEIIIWLRTKANVAETNGQARVEPEEAQQPNNVVGLQAENIGTMVAGFNSGDTWEDLLDFWIPDVANQETFHSQI